MTFRVSGGHFQVPVKNVKVISINVFLSVFFIDSFYHKIDF